MKDYGLDKDTSCLGCTYMEYVGIIKSLAWYKCNAPQMNPPLIASRYVPNKRCIKYDAHIHESNT